MDTNTQDWLFEHCKSSYEFQLERSEKIRDRVSFLSGLLTPFGGAIIYVFLDYPHHLEFGYELLFYIPASLALIYFFIAVAMLLYCLGRGFKYYSIPTPKDLRGYAIKLDAYAKAVPAEKIDVLNDAKKHLLNYYCEDSTYNFRVNTRRANILLLATQISIISFGLLLISLPRFFFDKTHEEASPTKIVVSQPIRIQP
jgi:hypothetical protein